nr:hypothetical protein [Tanacetum cinerariifolium]
MCSKFSLPFELGTTFDLNELLFALLNSHIVIGLELKSTITDEYDIQNDQNDVESDDKRVALANLLANLKLDYTQLAIPESRDTLIQHMESIKKSIDEIAQRKREYDSWVNERQMQTTEEKVDTSKALDACLVDTVSSGTDSKEQDTSSRSGDDVHDDDANIRPIYDEEPMAEVQTTAKINVFAIGQQHSEQPEFNNEGEVDQNDEQCHDTCPLPAN